jgi:hypothetical protein
VARAVTVRCDAHLEICPRTHCPWASRRE